MISTDPKDQNDNKKNVVRSRAQIIKSWRYDQQNQLLNLNGCSQNWLQVLQLQDWKQIKHLILNQCPINDTNIDELIKKEWINLQNLKIQKTQISVPNLSKLLLKIDTQNIKELNLSRNNIGCNGVKILVKSNFNKLTNINLNECGLNSQGIHHLIKCNFPELQKLSIMQNNIKFAGYSYIFNQNWKKLSQLYILSYYERNLIIHILQLMSIATNKDINQRFYIRSYGYYDSKLMKQLKQIMNSKFYSGY